MDAYRALLYDISLLVAWWALAAQSYAALPADPGRVAMLGAASVWLGGYALALRRDGRLIRMGLVAALCLAPWALFLELALIADAPGLTHALVVYNAFRLALIAAVFLILARRLFWDLKNF